MVNKTNYAAGRNIMWELYREEPSQMKDIAKSLTAIQDYESDNFGACINLLFAKIVKNDQQLIEIKKYLVQKLNRSKFLSIHKFAGKILHKQFVSPEEKNKKEIKKQKLNQQKEDLSKELNNKESPLIKAIETSDTNAILNYVQQGHDFNVFDMNGDSPLHIALKIGVKIEMFTLLCVLCKESINESCSENNTILHKAVLANNQEAVKVLLAHGAKASSINGDEDLPLHLAARAGYKEIVELLLPEMIDIDECSGDGLSALEEATYKNHVETVKYLLEKGANATGVESRGETICLHIAAQRGFFELIEILASYTTNINMQDEKGKTPLMLAAENGHKEIVSLLIGLDGDPEIKDEEGFLPYQKAKNREIYELLTGKKDDLNCSEPAIKKPRTDQVA